MKAEERARLLDSVRQRLLNIAQRDNTDFQIVLTTYGRERFLVAVSQPTDSAQRKPTSRRC